PSGTAVTVNAGDGDDNIFPGHPAYVLGPVTVNGQGGTDKLNYTNFTGITSMVRDRSGNTYFETHGVSVNLATGQATGLAGLSGIENVDGSGFDDTITGDSNANVLR